jgi:ABC-type molybdate transport system substrate-binding protein
MVDGIKKGDAVMRMFCARSMQAAVTILARQFHAGPVPDIVFEPMGALQARLAAGETADGLILAAPALLLRQARSPPAASPPSRAHRSASPCATAHRHPTSRRRKLSWLP